MKLKSLTFILTVLCISLAGCINTRNSQTSPAVTSTKTGTQVISTAPVRTEQTPTPKPIIDYSTYTGNWVCRDKKTSMELEIDAAGYVNGSITTVVDSHVPSSMIAGTIENDILIAKLEDDGGPYTGTLTLSFTEPEILKDNIKLENADAVYWALAEGELIFERY